jgi:hypothetical protein
VFEGNTVLGMNTGVTKQKVKRPNTRVVAIESNLGVRGKQDRIINLRMLYCADA